MANRTRHSTVSDEQAENRLIDHYQSQSMSSDLLHTMLDETQSYQRSRVISFALAASLLLMSLVVLTHQNILASQRTDTVMREVALNHSSKLKVDAESGSLIELQGQLNELPFEIKMPDSGFFAKLAVLGGRYCTLNGSLAAHLKLSDPETSKEYSLFLTPSTEDLLSIKSDETILSGVDVKLWHENDVVYAVAKYSGEVL